MPGYEDITPEQFMHMVNFISIAIIVYGSAMLIRSFIFLKISKNLKHLELMIEQKIEKGSNQPSLFASIRNWWKNRKEKKQKEEMYKPIETL